MINCDQIKSFNTGLPTSTHWSGYCALICSIVNTSIWLIFATKIRYIFYSTSFFLYFLVVFLWACPYASLRVGVFRASLRSVLRTLRPSIHLTQPHAETLVAPMAKTQPSGKYRGLCREMPFKQRFYS